MSRAFFVTGTDTGVGKTRIATGLLRAAREQGLSTLGLKPVAAGCDWMNGSMTNEDALCLQAESSCLPDYADVNPVALHKAMAPHIAAELEGLSVCVDDLLAHCMPQLSRSQFCVVEGAGGWLVPLNHTESMADLAARLGLPVILVVGLRLGCINHALLTATAVRAAGLPLAGWVANHLDPAMAVPDENIAAIATRVGAPLLGVAPWQPQATAADVAAFLQLDRLEPTP